MGQQSSSQRVRILSVIDGLGYAGDESRLLSLGRTLDRDRFHHSVLTINSHAYSEANEFIPRREQYIAAGVKVDDLSDVSSENEYLFKAMPAKLYAKSGIFRRALRLANVVRKWKVDVLDGHLESAGLITVLAGRLTRTPASITLYCGARVGDSMVWPWPTRLALRLADAVLTDSRIRATEMQALIPKQKNKVSVIPNGIPRPQSDRSAEEMRKFFGLPADPRIRIIGMIGRLIEYKGHEVLLQAAQQVLQQEPDAAFLAVGFTRNEAYKRKLQHLACHLGITERVVITAYPGDIADVWKVIDIHAHASLFDSLPISIAEGMSLGKPAVVTSAGGIPEIVEDGQTGIVVPPGDPALLAAALLTLLRDPILAQTLGRNARARYEHGYRPEIMARKMEDFFSHLATRSTAEAPM